MSDRASNRSVVLAVLAPAVALLALAACGGDEAGSSACGFEVGLGQGQVTEPALTPSGELVVVKNLTIFTNLGPVTSGTVIKSGDAGFEFPLHSHGSAPVVDAEGRTYVIAGDPQARSTLFVIDPDGNEVATMQASRFVGVSHDGTVVAGGPLAPNATTSRELVRYAPDGTLLVRARVAEGVIERVAIAGDGTVYAVDVGIGDGSEARVLALTPGFNARWSVPLGLAATAHLAIDAADGLVVSVGTAIIAFDRSGSQRFRVELSTGGALDALGRPPPLGPVTLGPDGTIYSAGGAVTPGGGVLWSPAPGSPIAAATDGTLYTMVAAPDPKPSGAHPLEESLPVGVGVIDPDTGAIVDRLYGSHGTSWVGPVLFADGPCGIAVGDGTLDGILFEATALSFPKASSAAAARPWGLPDGDAGRTHAAPLTARAPAVASDVWGHWVRDDGAVSWTLELAPGSDGDAYRLWETRAYDAGRVVQSGRFRVADGALVLERTDGAPGGSSTALAASAWTELDVTHPVALGAPTRWRRAYAVARPSKPSPRVRDVYLPELAGLGLLAAFDPADGAGWLVQTIDERTLRVAVHRLDVATKAMATLEADVPQDGASAFAPSAAVVDAARTLHVFGTISTDHGAGPFTRVYDLRFPKSVASVETIELTSAGLEPATYAALAARADGGLVAVGHTGFSALGESDVVVARFDAAGALVDDRRFVAPGAQSAMAVAVDVGGRMTIAGRLRGRLELGDGVVIERIERSDAGPVALQSQDLFIARFEPDGHVAWARRFPELAYDTKVSLSVWDDGTLALTGVLPTFLHCLDDACQASEQLPYGLDFGLGPLRGTAFPEDAFVARFDASGQPTGQSRLDDRTLAVSAADPSGLLVASGWTEQPGATPGLVAVFDRCGRELVWTVPPCSECGPGMTRAVLAQIFGRGLARGGDGRWLVAGDGLAFAAESSRHTPAALFVAPLVDVGDVVPSHACGVEPGVATHATLTVTLEGDGGGRVVSDPAGIDCPGACEAAFARGERVTLTATADAGATFAAWGAPCLGATDTCAWDAFEDGGASARFERPGRRVLRELASPAAFGRLAAGTDGGVVALIAPGTTAPGPDLVAIDRAGATRWETPIDQDVLDLASASDGSLVALGARTALLRWSSDGTPLPAFGWPAVGEPGVPHGPVSPIAFAAGPNASVHVVMKTTAGSNGITSWPAVDGYVDTHAADGTVTTSAWPGADVSDVALLPDGSRVIVFHHATPITFLGEPLDLDMYARGAAVARVAADGSRVWVESLANASPGRLAASAGGVALALTVWSGPAAGQAWPGPGGPGLLTFAPDGAPRWLVPSPSADLPVRIAILTDGAVVTTPSELDQRPFITRTDVTGVVAWTATGAAATQSAVASDGTVFAAISGNLLMVLGP